MNPPPPRLARVVLVTPDGAPIGVLPAVPVATPWWQDVEPVVEAVRASHGVEITVLRLLSIGEPGPLGIEITYLAETTAHPRVEAWNGVLDEHPLRLAYAKPGGPAADLAWATRVLARHGHVLDHATQIRTWNLSSLWRLRADGGAYWLKVTPPFMAHEGAILEALAGGSVPTLLGRENGRILMPEIPGQDGYDAREPALSPMVDLLVDVQHAWIGRTEELLGLGLNDWRGAVLARAVGETFQRNADALAREDRHVVGGFVDTLDRRLSDVAACGLPETLVHGDFFPGNLRIDGERLTLLDWGDSGVGHPLLDQAAFLDRIPAEALASVKARWRDAWLAAIPGSDPARASDLLAPIAALRQAVVYQGFLDRIEPSEHPYHRDDPAERLRRAAQRIAAERL